MCLYRLLTCAPEKWHLYCFCICVLFKIMQWYHSNFWEGCVFSRQFWYCIKHSHSQTPALLNWVEFQSWAVTALWFKICQRILLNLSSIFVIPCQCQVTPIFLEQLSTDNKMAKRGWFLDGKGELVKCWRPWGSWSIWQAAGQERSPLGEIRVDTETVGDKCFLIPYMELVLTYRNNLFPPNYSVYLLR